MKSEIMTARLNELAISNIEKAITQLYFTTKCEIKKNRIETGLN